MHIYIYIYIYIYLYKYLACLPDYVYPLMLVYICLPASGEVCIKGYNRPHYHKAPRGRPPAHSNCTTLHIWSWSVSLIFGHGLQAYYKGWHLLEEWRYHSESMIYVDMGQCSYNQRQTWNKGKYLIFTSCEWQSTRRGRLRWRSAHLPTSSVHCSRPSRSDGYRLLLRCWESLLGGDK